MEEVAHVAVSIVRGIASLAYMVGDGLLALAGPEGPAKERRKQDGEADEER